MSVRAITSPELTKQRGKNQYSEMFVIPRVPNVIYTARLNGVPTSTDMVGSIDYNTGVGTLADVLVDMTMLVGTTAGASDLGICRIRKAPTSSIFYIGELSHIDWQADCYLTIADDYDILPKHIKIVDGEFLIDYEEAYTDQHEEFEPVVNMGGHVVIPFSGNPVTLERDASNSWVFGATIASYAWTAPGSSNITNPNTATPTFEWDAEGNYVIYCTATTSEGKTYRGMRYVFVKDINEINTYLHTVRVNEGKDVYFEVQMTENADLTNMVARAFTILFAKDYYDSQVESIGYCEGEENVVSVGRISDDAMSFNEETGNVEITIQGWKYWLAKITTFPTGLERAINTPSLWTDMPDLNIDRAIFHLLRYRSTVLRFCDFYPSNDTRLALEMASINTNLWAQIEEMAFTSIIASLVFDRLGYAYLRVEPQLVPEADRTAWPVVQAITSDDWQDMIGVELHLYEERAQMLSSGIKVDQYGSGFAYFSLSPGHIPFPYGDPDSMEKLLLSSQSQGNALAGLLVGWDNRLFDDLPVEFVGNNRMFSVAQYCRASIVMLAADNPRGVPYNGYLCPRSIEYLWDRDSGYAHTIVQFEDESVEELNVDGDVPADSGIDEDFELPPPPTIPIPPPISPPMPPGEINLNHPKKVVIVAPLFGVLYTENFDADAADVIWKTMNNGLTEDERDAIVQIQVTPVGAIYILTKEKAGSNQGYESVYRAAGVGATWELVQSWTAYPVEGWYLNSGIRGIGVDPNQDDSIVITGGRAWSWPNDGQYGSIYITFCEGAVAGSPIYIRNLLHGTEQPIFWNGGGWSIAAVSGAGIQGSLTNPVYIRLNAAGAYSDTVQGSFWASGYSPYATSARGYDFLIVYNNPTNGYMRFAAGIETPFTAIQPDSRQGIAFSPTSNIAMAGSQDGTFTAYKTEDAGITWVPVSGVIPNGSDVWENCGDDNRFIFGGGIVIRFTGDVGASYFEKTGNLGYIAPLIDIYLCRFIE